MSAMDRAQTVRPTRPICWYTRLHGAHLNKVDMPDGDPQNPNPLFVKRSFTTPHSCIRVHTSSCMHGITPWRHVAASVPNLRLAQMHLDSRVLFEGLTQKLVDGGHALGGRQCKCRRGMRTSIHLASKNLAPFAMRHAVPKNTTWA